MPKQSRYWVWPALIVGLFAIHFVNVAALVVSATDDPAFAVEPDYYQKAVNWDAVMEQERRNAALGWQLGVTVENREPGQAERRVVVRLTDATGAPLHGAQLNVEAFHNARAGHVLGARLQAQGERGDYATALKMLRPGLWELRFEVKRGDDVFTASVRRMIASPSATAVAGHH